MNIIGRDLIFGMHTLLMKNNHHISEGKWGGRKESQPCVHDLEHP